MEERTVTPALAEARMHEAFRAIRNRLRRHRPADVVDTCISILRSPQTPQRMAAHPPWFLIRLIEWTFEHGDFSRAEYHAFGNKDLNYLVRLMMKMNEAGDAALTQASAPQLIKNMAHEQFPWRDPQPAPKAMARNMVLFLELNTGPRIAERFQCLAGIPLEVFLDLSWLLWCHFFPPNQRSPDYVGAWSFGHPVDQVRGSVKGFLDLLSLPEQQAGPFLHALPKEPDTWYYRLHKEPRLKRKPLLRRGSRYYQYSRTLLARALEHFAYDILREDDPCELMAPFRTAFEQYVGIGVDGIGDPHICEPDLRAHLPTGSKVVDYLVVSGDVNVLIDAKCVEMHRLGRISTLADKIEGKLKSSVISGIEQGNAVAGGLSGRPQVGDLQLAKGPWHLIVVTYKNLYIGQGPYLRHIIGSDGVANLARKLGDPPPIPYENVHFLSVDEFDSLVCTAQQGVSLAAILKAAAQAYQQSDVWVFEQVLNRYKVDRPLARHVEKALLRHGRRIGQLLAR